MSGPEFDALRWLAGWENTSALMEQLRRDDLAHVDVGLAIEALDDAFTSAQQHRELPKTSGLVIQQAWFMKGRR